MPKAKSKTKVKKQENLKPAYIGIFVCGLIAVVYAVLEGFVFKSTVVMTGASGTYTMNPLVSSLMILAGLIGMGFGVWGFITGKKLND